MRVCDVERDLQAVGVRTLFRRGDWLQKVALSGLCFLTC